MSCQPPGQLLIEPFEHFLIEPNPNFPLLLGQFAFSERIGIKVFFPVGEKILPVKELDRLAVERVLCIDPNPFDGIEDFTRWHVHEPLNAAVAYLGGGLGEPVGQDAYLDDGRMGTQTGLLREIDVS